MDYLENMKTRICKSFTSVVFIYLVYASIGVIGYGVWSNLSTNSISFAQLCMTIGTIWGLLQISFLMGYGLVLLPQSMCQNNDI